MISLLLCSRKGQGRKAWSEYITQHQIGLESVIPEVRHRVDRNGQRDL